MNNTVLKKIGIYAGVLLLFIGLAYGFTPEVFEGKIVNQGDISQWKGMANEAMTYNEAHPEDPTAWSNAMFGGMPTTATIDSFEGDYTDPIYDTLLTGRRPASYLLIALIGGFLLMLSLGTSILVAVGGAIAMAFCSYNFQIITAGHNTKMQAIAYFPWVLAAVIFTYRSALKGIGLPRRSAPRNDVKADAAKVIPSVTLESSWKSWIPKVILGAVLFGFALSFQIKANHPQITYYLGIVVIAYALGLFIYLCIDKKRWAQLKRFVAASALLLVIGIIGMATNANKLIPTMEYSKYTMRGGSELSADSETHNNNGLDLEYATQWSYGINEMPNLLIPNYNGGGSSSPLPIESETGKFFTEVVGKNNAESIVQGAPTYWGPQPFTAGPMYMGAITIFLFILGMILCKGREKWWMLAAVIIAVLLSWGHHFMAFTRFWFEHVPMYNKFRTVSMALTVLQVVLPMLGFLVLDRVMNAEYDKRKLFTAGGIALALTAGFCLIGAFIPGTASLTYDGESARLGSMLSQMFGMSVDELAYYGITVDDWKDALIADRKHLLSADAYRSLILIIVAAALMVLPYLSKTFQSARSRKILTGCVVLVVLFDLWGIGKRYLNEDNFITPKDFTARYNPRPADNYILEDKDPDFRVLDLTVDPFNNATPSYHHKCIGGYSPVKMQRYQDLITYMITPEIYEMYDIISSSGTYTEAEEKMENLQVISMLNGRYIIYDGKQDPLINPHAFGNAWFVNDYVSAATPDEELALLKDTDLSTTAVIGDDFKWARLPQAYGLRNDVEEASNNMTEDVMARSDSDVAIRIPTIELIHYAPNELRYDFSTESERAAIFSEVYYPKGWKAWIEPAGTYGEVIDGRYQPTAQAQEVDIFRANWILRGVVLPEGEGTLIMRFEPESYHIGENVSRISSILLILLLLGSAGAMIWLDRRK